MRFFQTARQWREKAEAYQRKHVTAHGLYMQERDECDKWKRLYEQERSWNQAYMARDVDMIVYPLLDALRTASREVELLTTNVMTEHVRAELTKGIEGMKKARHAPE